MKRDVPDLVTEYFDKIGFMVVTVGFEKYQLEKIP